MSPELLLSGHVSKASDLYAFGICMYELLTDCTPFAGVPTPLLPHEVACQGLRPAWPPGLPLCFRQLQRLAEACWAQQPQHR
jgi:serine/threonine protein kinase